MSKSKYRPRRRFTNPMWWNHLMTEIPNRREVKRLEKVAVRNPDEAEDLMWPVHKKPHCYFW